MKADIYNNKGKKLTTKIELNDKVFSITPNDHSVYLAIKSELASKRQGTSSSKTRSEVRGGGAKPWKQKGTGRSRVGSSRNPSRVHGGSAFGPKPRDYDLKVNKKVKLLAKRSVLSSKVKSDSYKIIDNLDLNVNFNSGDIINTISNYKHIPFFKYHNHIKSLQKFNLYSQEVSLYYLSEIFKPFFLIILCFVVMSFSSKFKKNENFFKVLFYSILIGFLFFSFNEILTALTIANYISFLFAYATLILISLVIGLYQSINIEVN